MISDQELRRKLRQIRERLDLARSRSKEEDVIEVIDGAEALVEELESTVSSESAGGKKYSILEWKGVGKELWSKIDVDEYIRQERESWA